MILEDLSFIDDFIKNVLVWEPTESTASKKLELFQAAKMFSDSGWIPPYFPTIELCRRDIVKLSKYSPQQIDDYIYSLFQANNFRRCKILIRRLKKIQFPNPQYFDCAMLLYKKKQYLGCCIMSLALIEQVMRNAAGYEGNRISNKVNPFLEKTFEKMPILGYSHHPIGDFMEEPLKNVLTLYFKHAEGFINEPPNINRNFLMHGMAMREYTHRDCIKLLLTLDFIGEAARRNVSNAQPTT